MQSVAAVVITRNRIPLLRKTLLSLGSSTYPFAEIIVSDDSSDDQTARMLAEEFPGVTHVTGPRRGISANRNNGMNAANSDYILISDDDMLIDPSFVESALDEIHKSNVGLVFAGISDDNSTIFPNTSNFLGFSTIPYRPGMAYNTANQQCFLITKALASRLRYDEVIVAYGYEEMDFAYRVAASGSTIHCVNSCVNIHLAPNVNHIIRPGQDGCRLYVMFKRLAFVDRRPLKSFLYLAVALPHHLLSSVKRLGFKGIALALANFRLAFRMVRQYVASLEAQSFIRHIN